MITLLAKWLIKDRDNTSDPVVRQKYGVLCGALGIFLNIVLFAAKLLAGMLSGSIAITADAINNLSDAGSSVVTLAGFKIAAQKPDPEHPFGHGRVEYISGLVVSLIILVMGVELLKSSVEKVITPVTVEFSIPVVIILAASVLIKLYMAFFNRGVGKKIQSPAVKAAALDSISDCITTTVVLLSMFVGKWTGLNIDSYCGIVVALFILYAGFRAAKETISPLLGQPPEKEFVDRIENIILSHQEVKGIHDLVVHDYGPGRRMVTVHAEVPANADILVMHDCIDNIERDLAREMGCTAVIHMDPIITDDQTVAHLRTAVEAIVMRIDQRISIHDFRIVSGPTHTNLIFDVVVPYDKNLNVSEIKRNIECEVHSMDEKFYAVVQIDRSFVL